MGCDLCLFTSTLHHQMCCMTETLPGFERLSIARATGGAVTNMEEEEEREKEEEEEGGREEEEETVHTPSTTSCTKPLS